jgi:hypothetical protein
VRNKRLAEVSSDFLVNLSAGWAIAAFVVPTAPEGELFAKVITLTMNILFAIVSFVIAYRLKKT